MVNMAQEVQTMLEVKDLKGEGISISRSGEQELLLVQNARPGERPYLHPLRAPAGGGVLTEIHPSHHVHQTGLYFGLTGVNGQSYFHRYSGPMFKRREITFQAPNGNQASWRVAYDLLDDNQQKMLGETLDWKLTDGGDHYLLDVIWSLEAAVAVTFKELSYGGLFLRMPFRKEGQAVNSEGQINSEAEGQRANWVDVGMPIEGRSDWGRITLMDHPANHGHPLPWRVDSQLGVGPCRSRLSAWEISAGATSVSKFRFLIYTGDLDIRRIDEHWSALGSDKP